MIDGCTRILIPTGPLLPWAIHTRDGAVLAQESHQCSGIIKTIARIGKNDKP